MSPPRRRNPRQPPGGAGSGGGGGGFQNIPLPGMPDEPPEPTPRPARAGRRRAPAETTAGVPLAPGAVRDTDTRTALFTFLTGRDGAAGALTGDRAGQMIAAFGASHRDPTRPDTAAAAKAMGVSTRSVQRWLAGAGMRPAHAQTLTAKARQAFTTKRGRERVLRGTTGQAMPRGRNAITISGVQGVVSGDTGNYRPRTTTVPMSEDDWTGLRAAWAEHGEAGGLIALQEIYARNYCEGWQFESIEKIDFGFRADL